MNQPLWKLLGGAHQRVATYASGSLRRTLPLDEVVTAAGRLKEKGFREAKMQLALPGPAIPAKEVERAERPRQERARDELGEIASGGQRVVPRRALDAGFEFGYPELEPAFREVGSSC